MKLKTYATKDLLSSDEYWRGLPASRAQHGPLAQDGLEEELRCIDIESFSAQFPAPEPQGSDVPPGAADGSGTTRSLYRSPRLIGERAHRFHFLDTHAVDYLQVDGNYVTIYVGNDRYVTRSTLKHLSDVLSPYDFLRIDRSVLLNLRQVDYVERLESGQFSFRLRRGQQLVSSRERSSAIARLLRSGVR